MFIRCFAIKHLCSQKLNSLNKGMFFNNKNMYKNYRLLLLRRLAFEVRMGMLDIKHNYIIVIVMTLGGTQDRPGEICHFEKQNEKFPLVEQE